MIGDLNGRSRERAEGAKNAIAYSVFGIAALLYYTLCFRYGIDLDDEGFLIGGATDILDGKFPIADFSSYQPWMYFSLASFFRLFGTTLLVERAFLILYLLASGLTLLWISRRVLPHWIAFIPAGLYAVAPGPWYKVFFIFHLILVLASLLLFDAKPQPQRALLAGLVAGFALVGRQEAGALALLLFAGALGAIAIYDLRFGGASRTRFLLLCGANAGAYIFGAVLPVAAFGLVYYLSGKFGPLIENLRYYATPEPYSGVINDSGLTDAFSLSGLFARPDLEHLFYGISLLACLALFLMNLIIFFGPARQRSRQVRSVLILSAAALCSMGYTFFFVWNSRMLSSFAIVYLAEITLLYQTSLVLRPRYQMPLLAGGAASLLLVVHAFCAVNFYSGSITMRVLVPGHSDSPFLKGAIVDASQVESIDLLRKFAANDPEASLIPMSEATTMGFISGLKNPTYYRLFTMEISGKARQERAIATFDRLKIKYFVARSGQFITGGAPASDLASYAPLVKDYLLEHYLVQELGRNYVILIRRDAEN